VGTDRYAKNQAYQALSTAADTATAGPWTSAAPVDVFGRYRNRSFMGDGSGAGKDSSIYSGLLFGRNIVRTYFGNRLSGLCMAPRDDYTSRNFFDKQSAFDSLFYVIKRAGFSCLRTDVQSGDADPGRWKGGVAVMRGGLGGQGVYSYSIFDTSASRVTSGALSINVLGQSGHSTSGSMYLTYVPALNPDTAVATTEFYGSTSGSSTHSVPHATIGRFWHGLCHDTFTDPDWGQWRQQVTTWSSVIHPLEDQFSPTRHASILKMHAGDFGGIPNGPPRRPGWWALKSIDNQFAAINAKAGRTVCAFSWPEDIAP